jgi:hypothetical protein
VRQCKFLSVSIIALAWLGASQPAPPPSALNLRLFPEAPTTEDFVEVQLGGGGPAQPALRASGSNSFYISAAEPPTQATYTLGVLAPGDYTFSLFRTVPGALFCTHELRGRIEFTVRPALPSGSGRLILLLDLDSREAAQSLIERENPQTRWLFDTWVQLLFLPGLEAAYAQELRGRPEVAAFQLNSVGFLPECPPPLGAAFAPGSLLVKFREGIGRSQGEEFLRRLPPELRDFQLLPRGGSQWAQWPERALAQVQVPSGWEALFLQRYLRYPQVLAGWVVPALPQQFVIFARAK